MTRLWQMGPVGEDDVVGLESNCIDLEMDEGYLEEAIVGGQDAGYNQGCVGVNNEGVVGGEVGKDEVVIGVNDVVDIGVNDEVVESDEVLHDECVAGVNDEGGNDGFSTLTKGGGDFEVVAASEVGMIFHSMEDIEKYYRSYGVQQGFDIVRAATSLFKGKEIMSKKIRRSMLWTCDRYGRPNRRRKANSKKTAVKKVVTESQMDVEESCKA